DQDLERRNRLTATGLDLNAGSTSASDGTIASTGICVSELGGVGPDRDVLALFWRRAGAAGATDRPQPRIGKGQERTGATGLEPATSGVTGRRSNQLNYAPERREIVAAVPRPGRSPGVSADFRGEPRRLDCGGRDRARRAQRLPARAPDGSAVARGARGGRARRGTLRTRDRRWREPVRAARRTRRRGDRRHARADGRRVHRPLGARADLDPAAAALARLRRR